jgi:cytochrome c-type biogenesis protein CcmF
MSIATLGTASILLLFLLSLAGTGFSAIGAARRSERLIEAGLQSVYASFGLAAFASALIIYAFVAGDYSIQYVQKTSDAAMPLFYKITSFWGGLDGSMLFWVLLHTLFASLALHANRDRHRELVPHAAAVLSVITAFFAGLLLFIKDPFSLYLLEVPSQGKGLNPLLQNLYMIIHPPSLYLGYVSLAVPYAFGMAALITGQVDAAWQRSVRRWTLFSWMFLTFGLILGGLWAYEELGWGGYWAWDPVENAGLLPWFTVTAFLHSIMIQERRGMMKVWNVSLVIVSFLLTIVGTFMTRSGVVQSVHAFGADPVLAWTFGAFMLAIVLFSFGLVIWRLPLLRSRGELESVLSREFAFLVNNWLFLVAAIFVLGATMWPTFTEWRMILAERYPDWLAWQDPGERVTIGAPFFNRYMRPLGLSLLLLTGVGPLLAWRKTSQVNLVKQFLGPLIAGVVTVVALLVVGLGSPWGLACFGLCAFTFWTIVQEFYRGVALRRRQRPQSVLDALIGLVLRARRRYGGYIVHLGIVLMFLGFAGQGYKLEENMKMNPGQTGNIGDFTIRHDSLAVTSDEQKQMITGHVTVLRDGQEIAQLTPARWFFAKHEDQPTTEVAIRRAAGEDLYLVLAAYEVQSQNATYAVTVNPLVNWIWLGFGVLAFGTGLAMLPERALVLAGARVPEGAATTTLMLLLMLLPAAAQAQTVIPRSELRRQLEADLMCKCGGCKAPMNNCQMGPGCHGLQKQNAKLDEYLAKGMTREQILAAFVADHGGQDILAAPLDEGFNRLAWALPYAVGVTGAAAVGLVALRWSRRRENGNTGAADDSAGAPVTGRASNNIDALRARLDDELRDLD